jgi:hypothetical protein
LPGVVVLGGSADGPSPRELRVALRYPDVNVVLDLSRMRHAKKWSYIHALLPGLADLRRRTGIPHRLLIDEAHYLLQDPGLPHLLDLDLSGYTLVTYQPSRLPPEVLAASEAIVATRLTDTRELEALAASCGCPDAAFDTLELGQAILMPTGGTNGESVRMRLAPRLTSHVRHREKYLDVPVARDRAFVFTTDVGAGYGRASSLREFTAAVASRPAAQLDGFLRRGDFSRWIADVFSDNALAMELRAIEDQYRLGRVSDVADSIVHAVEARYEMTEG